MNEKAQATEGGSTEPGADGDSIASASLTVPLIDAPEAELQRKFVDAAAKLVGGTPRFFEIHWDSQEEELELRFCAQSGEELNHMVRLYRQEFPGLVSNDVSSPTPKWLTGVDPTRLELFYVTNAHAHPFVLYDLRRVGKLMDPLLASLERYRYAWVQVVWQEFHSAARHLTEISHAIQDGIRTAEGPVFRTVRRTDEEGRVRYEDERQDHPAKGSEFHLSSKRLLSHLAGKSGSRLCAVAIRGILEGSREEELPFYMVEDGETPARQGLPFSSVSTHPGEGKIGEHLCMVDSKHPLVILDMVDHRFDLSVVERQLRDFSRNYLKERELWNPPFILMTPQELALLVHLPNARLGGDLHFEVTRGSGIPSFGGDEGKRGIVLSSSGEP